MPTIPNVDRIDRALPSGQRPVVTADTRAYGTLADVGREVQNTATVIKRNDDIDRRSKMDEADLIMATALEKEKHAYDQDSDYGTIGSRSEESMAAALENAGQIVDQRDLSDWKTRQGLFVERTRNHIGKVAWVKERDDRRANFTEQSEMVREAALTANADDLRNIMGAFDNRLESMVDSNYLTAQEAAKYKQTFQTDVSKGRLRMMEAEDRLAALDEPWAENIPADERAVIRREAEKEVAEFEAIDLVDAAMNAEGSTEMSVHEAVDAIEDPRARMLAERFARTELAARKSIDAAAQADIYNRWSVGIETGGMRYTDLNPDQLLELTDVQRANLRNLEQRALTGTKRTVNDPSVFAEAVRGGGR